MSKLAFMLATKLKSAQMGRPPAENPRNVQINFRVDQSTAKALDAEILVEQRPGLVLSRGDIARMLMAEALEARAERRRRTKK